MAQRTVQEVMEEGWKLTMELVALKRKKVAGTATDADKERILELDNYLLGMVGEAQALGVGVGYDAAAEFGNEEEDEVEQGELFGDDYEDQLLLEEDNSKNRGGDPFGGRKFW